MPSRKKGPLKASALTELEAQRDLAQELLESVREMMAGKVSLVLAPPGGHRADWSGVLVSSGVVCAKARRLIK
jgi:hypothetical protein